MNFLQVIGKIRKEVPDNTERGRCFEKICKAFLKNDPRYKDMFSDVWTWDEFPERKEADTGVDLVAREASGGYWAIQCKFYDPEHTLDKSQIDSFFTTSGRYGFSRRVIISTTDNWTKNAEQALEGQSIEVQRWGVRQMSGSPVEWENIYKPDEIITREKKKLRPHQQEALTNVVNGFKEADRGQLIMACGTGKTLVSLKIMENIVPENGNVLFLVPSISLLSQALNEWASEAETGQRNFAVCSDSQVGKDRNSEDIRAHELAFPTTTDHKVLAQKLKEESHGRVNIVFSTYHSIDVVSKAQELGAPEFDLVICDEAHRTTGVEKNPEDASYFHKIHNADSIKAGKRLYMTATPRIYSDSAKEKAREYKVGYFSMDEEENYGREFHRLNFSEAIKKDLLSDYRVLVLAVNEEHISATMQSQLATDSELNLEDTAKIIGCYKGLKKEISNTEAAEEMDMSPMRRAVAFCNTIKNSKYITETFEKTARAYVVGNAEESTFKCEFKHVDGKQNSLVRDRMLGWLKEDPLEENGNSCRVLSNARCLSEGVDVPALDAVMFLNPRKSVVDVVQSVGRVMRKTEGKQYGYVILPVVVPVDVPADEALQDNKRYQVVWEVLQALRSHDDRFNTTVNKIELNKTLPDQIRVIGVGFEPNAERNRVDAITDETQIQMRLDLDKLREAMFARIVEKCGDRRYWEKWASDVSVIAERNVLRIRELLGGEDCAGLFSDFLSGLRASVNPSITEGEAIEMLSQHLITKPVFNALFEDYRFTEQNPVSKTMQGVLDLLESRNLDAGTESLERFYDSVRERAGGIDNAEGRQKIIIELYDRFFKTAFPRMAERLGIVYTPIEIVDFILRSAENLMRKEFGKGLTDEGVDILDPFTGTGSFMVRLLQGDFIKAEDLRRKYEKELHANEIVLLAYYIAAINIEEAYHFCSKERYKPFAGMLLTDTFQMSEEHMYQKTFAPENAERAERQGKRNIRVIIGNPPYSAGQRSENDANKNFNYPKLDKRIKDTYAKYSSATYLGSLYDSYIRSIRWASDRIGDEGIIGFVSNGYYIDGRAMDGLRKCIEDEFTSIYCFNLRGNIRKNMQNKKAGEGANVFGQASMTGIAVTLFVKGANKTGKCEIYYHDIGDYLTQKQKLEKIKEFESVENVNWKRIEPNERYDWINQRHPEFEKWLPLGDKSNKKKEVSVPSVFSAYSAGIKTNRDVWTYNYSKTKVEEHMKSMIEFYNSELERYKELAITPPPPN